MAGIGKIIFRIMIGIIVLLVAAIALIIGLSVAGNSSTNAVMTSNTVGQINNNVILGCTFTPDTKQASDVLWEKVGLTGSVYKYVKGKPSLADQNSAFKGRTSLFPTELTTGNASLLLSNVQLGDAGTYKCTITNSQGTGSNTLNLNVGAFTPITVTNITSTTLRCDSPSWYPRPDITWWNSTSGEFTPQTNLTNSSIPTFVPGLSVMVQVISDFSGAVLDTQYTCIMQNGLAKAQGTAKFTVTGLKTESRLDVIGSAAILSPSVFLLCLLAVLAHPAAL